MAVNYINDNGFIYVRKMGGVDPAITKAQRVTIHTRERPGQRRGRQCRAASDASEDDEDRKAPKIHDLFIDIGVSSRKGRREARAHRRPDHA